MFFMVELHTFDNGMRLIVEKMRGAKTVACFVDINVGSAYDEPDKMGMAHLVEHLMFSSTKKRTNIEIRADFDKIKTIVNASTSIHHTRFYIKNISEYFETSFEILGDMLSNTLFLKSNIRREKKIVTDEILTNSDMNSTVLTEALYRRFFKNTSLSNLILGTNETLANISRNDILTYFEKYYVPQNMVISFAGDISLARAKALVSKYIKVKPTDEPLEILAFSEWNHMPEKEFVSIEKDVNQCKVEIMIPAYNSSSELSETQSFLVSILNGSSGRLFKRIREELGLVYHISSYFMDFYNCGIIGINFSTSKKNLEHALREINNILNNIKINGVTKEEVAIEKIKAKVYMLSQAEQTISVAGGNSMDRIKHNRNYSIPELRAIYEQITVDNVNDVARKVLDSDNILCGVLGKECDSSIFDILDF